MNIINNIFLLSFKFFSKKYLSFLNYPARKICTFQAIESGEMDKKYDGVTLMLDGTPIPVSDSNDVGLAEYDLKKWKNGLDARDTVITDIIFRPIMDSLQGIAGWKRQPNQPLEPWKKEENRQITLTRGFLKFYLSYKNSFLGFNERRIGVVKGRYEFCNSKYRGLEKI